jgi:recombination protein RecR
MQVFNDLIEALRRLPTIGPKTARRMALHLLQRDRNGAIALSQALTAALDQLTPCEQCRQLSATALCEICSDTHREQSLVCVVSTLDDLIRLEQSDVFHGRYFVLNGLLSPIDGVGPEQLGLTELFEQISHGHIREIIIALGTQVEGEATAHFIQDHCPTTVAISRLAQGIPLGQDLSRFDPATLGMAVTGRTRVDSSDSEAS